MVKLSWPPTHKESEAKIKQFRSDLVKSVETFDISYQNFLLYRVKRMTKAINDMLKDISSNGF
jgi:hypothetical protein